MSFRTSAIARAGLCLHRRAILAVAFLILAFNPGLLRADVRLPKVFASHMVLQRDAAAPVWGWAADGSG